MGEWINVKDRLPEITEPDVNGDITFSGHVLTFMTDGEGFTYMSVQQYTTNNGGKWLMGMPEDRVHVTHWMSLPEPPTN